MTEGNDRGLIILTKNLLYVLYDILCCIKERGYEGLDSFQL